MNLRRSLSALIFGLLFIFSNPTLAQSTKRDELIKEVDKLRSELKVREDALLEPSNADRESYAEFLDRKNSGLVRLMPRQQIVAKEILTTRGGGAYFSFTRLTHEYGYATDIELEQGNLSVGFAGADYGLLANLGDIPLDEITLDSRGVEMLASMTPATRLPDARIEQHRSGEGIQIGSVFYKSSLPVVLNSTYVLRSINYDNSDVLVAFRIIRKDTDESVILAWKMLRKGDLPRLDRASEAIGQ